MLVTNVQLSDGRDCEVRMLGLYALDGVGPPLPSAFTYRFTDVNGREITAIFDIYAFSSPPSRPSSNFSEVERGSRQWWDWNTYTTYQQALLHEAKSLEQTAAYIKEVSAYIIREALVNPKDKERIVTALDNELVVQAAIVPQLNAQIIAQVLKHTFQASFDGKEILEAIESLKGGSSKYNPLAVWENQLMVTMGLTEMEYIRIPLLERARKVISMKLEVILGALEANKNANRL